MIMMMMMMMIHNYDSCDYVMFVRFEMFVNMIVEIMIMIMIDDSEDGANHLLAV